MDIVAAALCSWVLGDKERLTNMPKVYLLATVVALATAGMMLSGCPHTTEVQPNPQFEATPERGDAPLKVHFNDVTRTGRSPIRAWHWTFGDGAIGTGPSPVHEYRSSGVYTVTLRITTGEGEFTIRKEDLITVLPGGSLQQPDPDTLSVSAEGVTITVPDALRNSVSFGIRKDNKQLAPTTYEQIVLMSETFVINTGGKSRELFVYDAWDRPVPTIISMPLLDRLPVPVLDPAALMLLARLPDGRTIPIPGNVRQNRFEASVLRMPSKARYAVALRPETISETSKSLEALYNDRLAATDNWAEYWRAIGTLTTLEEMAALQFGDINIPASFERRDFSESKLDEAGATFLAVAKAVHNLLAESEMRVPTLVMQNDWQGGTYHNAVLFNMYPQYSYDIDNVGQRSYYDYSFGHVVVDPAQLLAITVRNARIAAGDPDAIDVKQRLSAASAITEAITKSTYAGYQIPRITTTGGGPLNLPVPADTLPSGQVRPVDFMEALLDGAPIYLAQRVEDFLLNTDVDPEDFDLDLEVGELRKLGRGFDANEYALLSAPLFFPYRPDMSGYSLSGQDFFCYLHNDADFEEPLVLLIGVIEAIAEEIEDYLEDAFFPVDFAQAFVGLLTVLDEAVIEALNEQEEVTDPESKNLNDFYWKYLKDRAYINSGEALLRPSDVYRPPFSFNEDRFDADSLLHVQIDSATDEFVLDPEDHVALKDVMPMSGRAVVIDANSLTNELALTFNTGDWNLDDDGYGPAVAVFKEGSTGIDLSDPPNVYRDYEVRDTNGNGVNDTIIVRRLGRREQDDPDCVNRVIVIIGNLNYEDLNDIAITVTAYSDLVVPEAELIKRYVYACDPLYEYSLQRTYNLHEERVTAFILNMTSGAWRSANDVYETVWEHELAVIEPHNVRENTAMLLVSGGSIGRGVSGTELAVMAELARSSGTIVAVLAGVPNQPLSFAGERRTRREDAIIAYSYDKYMNSVEAGEPEPTWPVLLPMTRAAVRALDTIQDFMAEKPGEVRDIDNFVVAGASKRGWTTWLTAVAETAHAQVLGREARVSAIIPMVIDVLNMPVQIEHHFNAYRGYPFNDPANNIIGGYSRALSDYVEFDIFNRFDTNGGQSLLEIVDPYSYREILTMPKLIANSTGDQFFLPDSSRFYFDDLPGSNFLHYAANTDHSLTSGIMVDFDTLETILAFYRAHVRNMSRRTTQPVVLPTYNWEYLEDQTEIVDGVTRRFARIKVTADTMPRGGMIRAWRAYAPTHRDFRLESSQPPLWQSEWIPYDPDEGGWIIRAEIPRTGWRGFYAQLRFEGSMPGADFLFTTPVRVVPEGRYPAPHPDRD